MKSNPEIVKPGCACTELFLFEVLKILSSEFDIWREGEWVKRNGFSSDMLGTLGSDAVLFPRLPDTTQLQKQKDLNNVISLIFQQCSVRCPGGPKTGP